MKPLKISGACLAIAVLVAMAVAASARANARSSTEPTAPTIVAPQSFDPVISAEVAAVARLGIPLPRAREAIAVQSAVEQSGLVKELEAALGEAFGGVWYVPAAARLDVGVTSQDAARIAEAVAERAGLGSSVTEVPVDSSEAELTATQRQLNRRLSGLFAREEVGTRASVEDNAVYVELGSAVPASERAALESEASEAPVEVVVTGASRPRLGVKPQARCREFEAGKAFCDPTIVAGTRLASKTQECTTGPAVLPSIASTDTYVLTAGHCVGEVGESFSSNNKAGKEEEVGKVAAFLNEAEENNADVAAIKVENAFWRQAGAIPVIPAIAKWEKGKETEPLKVKGEVAPAVKAATCISGATSGFHCGTIKETKLTFGKIEELVEVEGTETEGGDSGGPWFSEKERLVQGIHKGENVGTGNPLFESFPFVIKRLKEVSKLPLELLTEANEKRTHGTTAFTCVEGGGAKDFSDAHCDNLVGSGKGTFGHEEIKPGTATPVDLSNEKTSHETKATTPSILRGIAGGITFEIQCTNFTGKGTITNKEIGKNMQNEGTKGGGAFTNCTVIRPENAAEKRHPCSVKGNEVILEPEGTSLTTESIGVSKGEMGVEFKPPAGKPFATFTFEGEVCPLKGMKIEVTGTAIATGNTGSNLATTNSGATLKFTTAMTAETLKIGAVPAEFSAVLTPTMYNETSKTTENPITLTTTSP